MVPQEVFEDADNIFLVMALWLNMLRGKQVRTYGTKTTGPIDAVFVLKVSELQIVSYSQTWATQELCRGGELFDRITQGELGGEAQARLFLAVPHSAACSCAAL